MKRQNRSGGTTNGRRNCSRKGGLVVLAAAAMAWSAQRSPANTLFFDSDSTATNGVTPGTGNWDLSTTDWYLANTNTTDQAWTDTTGTTTIADFAGAIGANTYTVTLGANLGALGLVFATTPQTSGNGYTISGTNTLTIGAAGIDASAIGSNATESINTPVTLGSTQSWNVGASGNLSVGGVVSGGSSVNLIKTGAGTVSLLANETCTGETIVNRGTVNVGSATVVGSLASTQLIMGGGSLAYGAADTVGANFSSGTMLNAGSSALSVSSSIIATGLSFALGAITRNSGSAVVFSLPASSTNDFFTTTTSNAVGSGLTSILGAWATTSTGWVTSAASGGSPGNITSLGSGEYTNDTWAVGDNTTLAVPANDSISNGETQSVRFGAQAANTLTLSGTNIIDSGGLLISSAMGSTPSFVTGSGSLTVPAGGGELVVSQNNTGNGLTFSAAIADNSGSVGLTKAGSGTMYLTGTNAYSGPTVAAGGSLQLGNGTTAGSINTASNITLGGSGTFTVFHSDNITIPNLISGAGTFSKIGTDMVTLSNSSNSIGFTNINGGQLSLGTTGVLGSSDILTIGNGELAMQGNSSAPTTVTVNTLNFGTGSNTITLTPNAAQPLTFTATNLGSRTVGSVELFRGTGLGGASGNGVATITITNPPVVSTYGAFANTSNTVPGINTTSAAVIRGALYAPTTTGTGQGQFVTYDPSVGVRPLNGSEQAFFTPSNISTLTTSNNNVDLNMTGAATLPAVTMNTLEVDNTSAGSQTLTIGGATTFPGNGLLFTGGQPITVASGSNLTWTGAVTGSQDLLFLSTDTGTVTLNSSVAVNNPGAAGNPAYVTFGGPGNFTVNDTITSANGGGVYIDGPGTVTLGTGRLTVSSNGTQINGGTLKFGTGSNTANVRQIKIAAAGTLDMNGLQMSVPTTTTSAAQSLDDVNGQGGSVINSNATTATLVLQLATTTVDSFSGTISGKINLNIDAVSTVTTGAQVLAGQNTYTGTTTITGGTLRLGASNALPVATSLTDNGAGTASTVPSIFDLAGFNQTIGSLAGATSVTTPQIINSIVGTTSTLTVNYASLTPTTYGGVINDNGGTGGVMALATTGSGTLVLTSANAYSGGTTITGGVLMANNTTGASATGTGPVNITGAELLLGSTGTVAGAVNANSGGIVTGTGTINSAVTLNSGGHLAPGLANVGTLTIGSSGSLTANNSSVLDYGLTNTAVGGGIFTSSTLVDNGTISLGTVGVNAYIPDTTNKFQPTGGTSPEIFNLIQYPNADTAPSITGLSVLNPLTVNNTHYSFQIVADPDGTQQDVQLVISFNVPESWAGQTSSDWGTAASVNNNWSQAQVPGGSGAQVTFPSVSNTTVNLDGNRTIGTMSFTGGTYTINSGSPGSSSLIFENGGNTATLSSSSGSTHIVNAPVVLGDAGFPTTTVAISTASSSDGFSFNGVISDAAGGTGGLSLSGSGTVALLVANTYTGGTTINGGDLLINSASSLGASSSTVTINAGTLEVLATYPANQPETRNFVLGSPSGTLQIDGSGQTYEIDGNITDLSPSSPGTLNLNTPGGSTLILAGTTSNTGGIVVGSNSVLQVGNKAGTIGGTIGGGTLTNNGVINVGSPSVGLGASTTATISASLSGTGPLTVNPGSSGSGTLVLSGSNSGYSGTVTVNNATLVLGSATSTTATGTGNLTLNNSTLTENVATSEIGSGAGTGTSASQAPTMTYSGTNVIDTSTGTLTIAEQFSGGTALAPVTINRTGGNGTLVLGVAGNTLIGVTAPFGGELFANFNNNVGSLVLAARGAGSVNSTYNFFASTGTITVNGSTGTINLGALNGMQPIGATAATRLGIGGLNTNSSYSGIIGTALPADIGVAKTGTGTFTLAAQNTYSGVALTNAGLAPTAVVDGFLIAGVSTAADGSSGPFGPTNGGTSAPGYVLLGNQGQGTGANAVILTTAALLAAPGVSVANPVVVSGGSSGPTTTAYTLSMGGAGAGTSTYSGGVILENNLTVTQATGGQVNITGGITGTDADTGPDSTTVVEHGFTGAATGVSGNNSGFQMITFSGPGSTVVSGSVTAAGPTNPVGNPNGFGIYDSNDPTLSGESLVDGTGPGYIYENGNGIISVTVNGGTTTFASANQYSGGTSVSGGQLIFGNLSSSLAVRAVSALNISGGVAQVGAASSHAGRNVLVLSAGWAIPSTTPTNPIDPTPVAAPALTLSGNGTLDLTNNDAIVQGAGSSGLTTITTELKQGFSGNPTGGAWTGNGLGNPAIISSTAATNPKGNTALAVVLAGSTIPATTSFDGVPVGSNDVILKYTYFGDANLDGVVNASDYLAIDNGFNSRNNANPPTGWQNGDFNYDGVINGDDYTLIDNAYNTQGGVSLAGISAGPAEMIASNTDQIAGAATSAVPEPATLGILGIGGAGLLLRRRRRGR